ncbi:MAG: hypothetical protein ACTSVL_04730 [Promethearchaeota archaeon]
MIDMKIGKILAIIGAVLSFLGIMFFTLIDGGGFFFLSGLQGFINIPEMFGAGGDLIAVGLGVDKWVIIVIEIVIILYLISWLFQFLGAKFRIFSLLGSILPLFVGIVIFLVALGVTADFFVNILLFLIVTLSGAPLVDGVIPLDVALGTSGLTVGSILVLLGALISFVSVFMKREDF